MQIFIDAEGNATIVTPQHIYQGSNISEVNVTSLAFTSQTTLQIAFVLPDGTTTNYYPMSFNYSSSAVNYYQYIIQQAFTEQSGSASIALLATDSQTHQQTSQLIPFTIESSVLPTLPDTPSQDEWTTLLQYVQQNSSNIANLQAIISDIESIANTANTNASQAVSTANEALSTAQQAEQTANALAGSIAQANTNASQAVSTANEAKTTAEQALQQVVEKQGTVVSVDNNYVPTLNFTSDPQTQINAINNELNTITVKSQGATFTGGDTTTGQYLQLGKLANFTANQAPIKIHVYGKVLISSYSFGDFDFEIIVPFTDIAQSNTARIIQYTNGVDESSTCINQIILDGTAVIIKVAGGDSDTVIPYNVLSIGSDFTISPSVLTDYVVNKSATILNCETTGFQVNYGSIDTLTSKSVTSPTADITMLTAETLNGATPVNINDFISNIGTSGYQKLPSGLIIQWGKVGAYSENGNTTQTFSVTLPIAFPTACLSVTTQLGTSDISGTSTNYDYYAGVGVSQTTITIAVRWKSQYTNSILWIAIGY